MFDFLDLAPDPDRLLNEARQQGVNLFGAGGFARAVAEALGTLGISVRAFVVTNPSAVDIDGVPVIALGALDVDARRLPLWVGVYNRNAASDLSAIAADCRANGCERLLLPQDYYEALAAQLGWRFWLADRRGYPAARPAIEAIWALLDDDDSRRQFLATLQFRLGWSRAAAPQPGAGPQYFPDEVRAALASRGVGCTFVDGGAYDGDTIAQAAANITLARAFAFEPDLANFTRLAGNVTGLGLPVTSYPCGLSAANEWLAFAADQGEGSRVAANGTTRIQCIRLDDCLVGEPVDYIKLDVEGHELAALAGMTSIITRNRPALAIAAYHRWDDLWRLPAFIREAAPDYRIFYRIHEHNTFDSVFYAVSYR